MSIIRKIIQSIRLFIGKFFFRKWIKRICKNEDYKIDEKMDAWKMIPKVGKNGGYLIHPETSKRKNENSVNMKKMKKVSKLMEIYKLIEKEYV